MIDYWFYVNISPICQEKTEVFWGHILLKSNFRKITNQVRILVVGGLDVAQEDRADDATAAPHEGNASVILKKKLL